MTADNVIEYAPGQAAWERITAPGYLPTETDARSAIFYFGQQVAADTSWLTIERFAVLREIVHIGALPILPHLIKELILACWSGFGPQMARAVDALVGGVRL